MPRGTTIESCPICGPRVEGYGDLLDGLGRAPARLVAISGRLDPKRAVGPGEWTVSEVLHHLVDAELIWGFRLRLILGGDTPKLHPVPAEQWPATLGYATRDPSLALALFRAMRRSDVDLLESLSQEAWTKTGWHAELGTEINAGQIAAHLGHHDLHHLRDLAALQKRG